MTLFDREIDDGGDRCSNRVAQEIDDEKSRAEKQFAGQGGADGIEPGELEELT